MLPQTFSVWSNNAEQLIKNPEDLSFLSSMKSDCLATFGSQDKVLARKVHQSQQHDKARATCQEKMKTENTSCTTFSVNPSLNESNSSNSGSVDSNGSECESVETEEVSFSTPSTRIRSYHRSSCTGMPAFIPHDI